MASREPEPDDAASGRRGGDDYPLLFKGQSPRSRPGLVARMLDRILAFFRESPGDTGTVEAGREVVAARGPRPGEAPEPPPAGWPDEPAPLGRPRTERSPGSPDEDEGAEGAEEGARVEPEEETREDEDEGEAQDEGEELAEAELEDGGEAELEELAETELEDGGEEVYEEEAGETGPPAPTPIHRATLQMLPGRLVPVKGDVVRQEIRFMRPSHPEREVTIGWERGTPPDHVTIDHPSVQMRHAGMRYRRGQWWIESLSEDQPVLLNGRPIGPEGGPRHLKDGDLVRLGDLDFRFRMP